MKKENASKTAKLVTKALNGVLRMEANSTACLVAYQPKAPESLSGEKSNESGVEFGERLVGQTSYHQTR